MNRAWKLCLATLCVLTLGPQATTVDPELRSSSRTIRTFWRALNHQDSDRARDCWVGNQLPLMPNPGEIWFMPRSNDVRITEVRELPVTTDRMLIAYTLVFRPDGQSTYYQTRLSHELVRQNGQWLIEKSIGTSSLPAAEPLPTPVTI